MFYYGDWISNLFPTNRGEINNMTVKPHTRAFTWNVPAFMINIIIVVLSKF